MRTRATVLIKKEDKILLIHRIKNGEEYFVLPGGGVEEGESFLKTAIREAKEETGLDVVLDKKLWDYWQDSFEEKHEIYLVTKFSGTLTLGGPEAERNSKENYYNLEWHSVNDLDKILIYPEGTKENIIYNFHSI